LVLGFVFYVLVSCDLYLFVYSGIQHMLRCVCVLFFVYPMLPVSLDCSFLDCPFGIL